MPSNLMHLKIIHNVIKAKGISFHIVKAYKTTELFIQIYSNPLSFLYHLKNIFQCVSRIGKWMYFQYICWKCKINGTYTCSPRLRHGSDL